MHQPFTHLRNQWMGALALFLVLAGGTAWAASELSKNEVKSKHIAKKQVKKSDLANEAVNTKKVRNASLLGEDFAPGQLPRGPQGEPGTARAYAYVSDDGTVIPSLSKGVDPTDVTKDGTGVYCFGSLGFAPQSVMATDASTDLGTAHVSAFPGAANSNGFLCEPGESMVITRADDSDSAADRDFMVIFN
jgi:hypothetical protein